MAFSCILVFLFSGSYLMVQGTQITLAREKIQPDDDILLLQNSNECRKNGDKLFPKCNKFSAAPLDAGCWCQCHSETSTGKNTFFEPNNTCVPVAFARQTSGCDLLFAGETTEGLLTFFPPTGIKERTVMVPENKTCSLQYGGNLYLQYLDCDGSWKEISHQSANDSLEVTPDWSTRRLQIRSKPGTTFLASNEGRILRMAVQCRDLNDLSVSANSSMCAMFKVEGRVTCPLPQQSPTGPSAALPKPTAGNIIISTATLPPLATAVQTSRETEPTTGPLANMISKAMLPPLAKTLQFLTAKVPSPVIPGIIIGSALFVIITVNFIICCGRCFKKRHQERGYANQESYAGNSSNSRPTDIPVDEVTESPNDNSQVNSGCEHVYAALRMDKRKQEIYSSTYRVPQSPAIADAPDASLGFYPHPETAKEQNNNKCQGNTEESVYDNVMSPRCKPASKNNEPTDKELTVVKITEECFHTGSAQSKVLNNTQNFGRHCYENYPERAKYINLQQPPVNGSLENNSDSEVDEVNESPNDNSQVNSGYEHVYAALTVDKREQGIYSSTYRVPQSPAVADAPDASLGFYPHPETAKEQNNNKCQGNTEESVYDNVMPPSCKPASKNNEPIEITEKRFHTGSAQSKVLNNTQSFGRHCYENYPERAIYINLQQPPVNGSLENNSDSEVSYYNLH